LHGRGCQSTTLKLWMGVQVRSDHDGLSKFCLSAICEAHGLLCSSKIEISDTSCCRCPICSSSRI
jgi:hypothetical protein